MIITNEKSLALVDLANSMIGSSRMTLERLFKREVDRVEKESFATSFVQHCIKEVESKFNNKSLLFSTDSSQVMWAKTPKLARLKHPEPGCIVVWTKMHLGLPTSTGHVAIVREVLDDKMMLTIETNSSYFHTSAISEKDGIYLKHRHIRSVNPTMQTSGFLLPWA